MKYIFGLPCLQACLVMIWEVDVDEKSRFGFWRQYRQDRDDDDEQRRRALGFFK